MPSKDLWEFITKCEELGEADREIWKQGQSLPLL